MEWFNSVYNYFRPPKYDYPVIVDQLKNALLSYAMMRVFEDKVNMFPDVNYKQYDGTTLPAMSGFNDLNACFTYLQDSEELKNTPLMSQMMIDKNEAIIKFINNNLVTPDQVTEFFNKYLEIIKSENIKSDNSSS